MTNINTELEKFNELCRVCANKTNVLFALQIFDGHCSDGTVYKKITECLPIKGVPRYYIRAASVLLQFFSFYVVNGNMLSDFESIINGIIVFDGSQMYGTALYKGVVVQPEDKLPKLICEECVCKLDMFIEFRNISFKTEIFLNELLSRIFATAGQNTQTLLTPPCPLVGSLELNPVLNVDKTPDQNNIHDGDDMHLKPELLANSTNTIIYHEDVTAVTISDPQLTLKSSGGSDKLESITFNGSTYILASEPLEHSSFFFCTLCSKSYAGRNAFDEHCANIHWNKCDHCSLLFTSQDAYVLHCAELHPIEKSTETDGNYNLMSHLESFRHLSQQQISSSIVESLKPIIETSITRKEHAASNDKMRKNKAELGIKFTEISEDPFAECPPSPLCILGDNFNENVENENDQLYRCNQCNKKYKSLSKFNIHIENHKRDKPFKCNQCQKIFRSKIGLDQHEATHTGQFDYECDSCGKGFQCKSYLIVHQRVHSTIKPYVCKTCNRNFKTKQSLLDHENRHLGLKPYTCDICGKSFITKGLCKSHQKIHSGNDNRQYPCPVCKKLFVSKSYLNTHIRIHTGEKPFVCMHCGKGFLTGVDLKIHNTMHTGEKSFVCETCGKAFARRDALRCHIRSHTGERPYRCNICGQTFTQFSPMAIHKRLHTGERPYACDICGKAFVSKSTMMSHHKKHSS